MRERLIAVCPHINLMTLVKRARKRGASIVVIDPYRTRTAREADAHLSPRPGTDAALALGVMHVLVRSGQSAHFGTESVPLEGSVAPRVDGGAGGHSRPLSAGVPALGAALPRCGAGTSWI